MKMKRMMLALSLALAAPLAAHEGPHEAGSFEPPHGGGFAKMAGHYAEVYLQDGKLGFCFLEPDGKPVGDKHAPKQIVLKVTPKGEKATTFNAAMVGADGCVTFNYATAAKRLKVEIMAKVEGKMAKATVNVFPKSGGAAMPAERKMAAAMYSCPMHPEVKSDKPGKCPKCGMDLVMKDMKGDGHAGHDHKD